MKAVRADKGAFLLRPGGEVVTGTPTENMDALIFSACRYRALLFVILLNGGDNTRCESRLALQARV
jgi:hypothetical protein